MSAFPVHDWQFWAVTAMMLAAVGYILWQLVPRLTGRKGRRHKATLTIGGKPVEPGLRKGQP